MTKMQTDPLALYSTLAADPDLGELVDLFVSELPDRVDKLQRALESGDRESLCRFAHQLKGAAGSYGFIQLTPPLKHLESLARDQGAEECLHDAVAEVVALCRRARGGLPT